jgi:hypothetical protein
VGDITDDVSSLDAESCLGLVGWLDFYHKVGMTAEFEFKLGLTMLDSV